ncbi:hypothetical protein HS048_23435 [Planomonospora sp. ID91781]|uniref:Uncharacterized protein n=1 Tax=Planomonospora sphaerica TaxID=161355 RepID=A0A171CXG0_9ACTN|nr:MULTISPECIES: hypothetical protein [Planomonospora]MBG0823677.1 hypothetical protein [Planomonospora sp. ID91781]GAT67377.1 hypothetical protein PS9374_03030 [Planomonospora sphaerica]
MSKQKPTPWDANAKKRIQSKVATDPNSPSGKNRLDRKAQSGADKNEYRRRSSKRHGH